MAATPTALHQAISDTHESRMEHLRELQRVNIEHQQRLIALLEAINSVVLPPPKNPRGSVPFKINPMLAKNYANIANNKTKKLWKLKPAVPKKWYSSLPGLSTKKKITGKKLFQNSSMRLNLKMLLVLDKYK